MPSPDPTATGRAPPRCCCGRDDCAFLRHNCALLDDVERDVVAAAKMGQALLARHEAFMASAERDRQELNARIDALQRQNAALEARNAETIRENRALLDQLEQLNTTVAESESRIRGLEDALDASRETVRSLEAAAARADDMERHVCALEAEQAALHDALARSDDEARGAMYRWKQAERGILDLQRQLEHMERQARDERERHADALDRLERQRAREKDLHTAAGRLKGAAAARSLAETTTTTPTQSAAAAAAAGSVVSHFVRDLLQDNANLQVGIAELRDMLMTSREEIQSLREQLLYHQPAALPAATATAADDDGGSAASTLRAELEPFDSPSIHNVSQELHIHHHYHQAQPKRPKRRRQALHPAIFAPLRSQTASPTFPYDDDPRPYHSTPVRAAAAAAPSSRYETGSASTISSSTPSEFASSSVPSSPRSAHIYSPLFDGGGADFSTLHSPTTSLDPTSPLCRPTHRKNESIASVLGGGGGGAPVPLCPADEDGALPREETDASQGASTLDDTLEEAVAGYESDDPTPVEESLSSSRLTVRPAKPPEEEPPSPTADGRPEPREQEVHPGTTSAERRHFDPGGGGGGGGHQDDFPRPLRRTVSHESIMSLSNGLDIHTLKARPSQLALRPLLTATAAGTGLSAVTAEPTLARGTGPGNKRGSATLRDNLYLAALALPPSAQQQQQQQRGVEAVGRRSASNPLGGGGRGGGSSEASSGGAAWRGTQPRLVSGTRALGKLVSWRLWGGSARSPVAPAIVETLDEATAEPSAESSSDGSRPAATRNEDPSGPRPAQDIDATKHPTSSDRHGVEAPSTHAPSVRSRDTDDSQAGSTTKICTPGTSTTVRMASSPRDRDASRAPGINQPGAIPGFYEYWAAHQRRAPPSQVCPDVVDHEALREVLEGG